MSLCRQCQRDPDEYDRALRRLSDQREQLAKRVDDLEAERYPQQARAASLATTTEHRRIVAWLTEERDRTDVATPEQRASWDALDSIVTDLESLIEATEAEATS